MFVMTRTFSKLYTGLGGLRVGWGGYLPEEEILGFVADNRVRGAVQPVGSPRWRGGGEAAVDRPGLCRADGVGEKRNRAAAGARMVAELRPWGSAATESHANCFVLVRFAGPEAALACEAPSAPVEGHPGSEDRPTYGLAEALADYRWG